MMLDPTPAEKRIRAALLRWCDNRDDPNDTPARMVRSWHMDLARDIAAAEQNP